MSILPALMSFSHPRPAVVGGGSLVLELIPSRSGCLSSAQATSFFYTPVGWTVHGILRHFGLLFSLTSKMYAFSTPKSSTKSVSGSSMSRSTSASTVN